MDPLWWIGFGAATAAWYYSVPYLARVAELADAPDLGSGSERSAGSIPVPSNLFAVLLCALFLTSNFICVGFGQVDVTMFAALPKGRDRRTIDRD